MSTTVFLGNKRVHLEDRDLLGVGGEGRVFRAGDRAIKVFFSMTEARRNKLAAFPTMLPNAIVGPLELCADANGNVVGYAMRILEHAVDIHHVAQRRWRDAHMSTSDVLTVFRAASHTVARLHAASVVVGDLNDGNVVVTAPRGSEPWQPWFIDADSMQFAGFPCTVAHERFLDPRLYGVDLAQGGALSRESDFYALAVLLFASLLLVHPYGGAHASYPTMLRRAEARHSVLRGDVKLPHSALLPSVLDDDALDWFTKVFDHDAREAIPPRLFEMQFTRCACGTSHARRVCPVCTVKVPVAAPVRALGRLRITTMTVDEGRRFVQGALDRRPVAHVEGDWLVRDDGTRIGQVLEGQTHVRTGDSFGFAFYRAGLFTMSFVFDTDRGPLRQLELPPIEGRLVDWSATFDDGHVLFCTATEKAGRAIHTAHLIDAKGAILASETGAPGSSAMLSSTFGKCLAHGGILAATDDGLVLVRADRRRRAFVPVRAFPETRDLVPTDAELLVGPGGSLYVVTHAAIVHLSFEGNGSS